MRWRETSGARCGGAFHAAWGLLYGWEVADERRADGRISAVTIGACAWMEKEWITLLHAILYFTYSTPPYGKTQGLSEACAERRCGLRDPVTAF